MRFLTCLIVAWAQLGGAAAPALASATASASLSTEVAVLLKILTFDQTPPGRAEDELLIVVIEQPRESTSVAAATDVLQELAPYEGQTVAGRRLRAERRAIRDLLARDDGSVEVVYLTEGVQGSIPEILEWTRRNGCLSFAGVPGWERRGIGIWLGEKDNSPNIMVNLLQVRGEGREFDARFLAVATLQQ